MMYVFEDGRIIYDKELLTDDDSGNYIEIDKLPVIPDVEGKTGYLYADLKELKVKIGYYDTPQPEVEPEPEPGEVNPQ